MMERFSKEISYVLRHAPWKYGLEMDQQGWVSVDQLLDRLHETEAWKNVCEADLIYMIEGSKKKRYEIKDGKIRACYGHSISMKIVQKEQIPPDILYHGTARRFLESILENGLLPQSRQYVHLSQDIETAKNVGMRHDKKPCILMVDAKEAWKDGIKFYDASDKIWLADSIPARYLKQI